MLDIARPGLGVRPRVIVGDLTPSLARIVRAMLVRLDDLPAVTAGRFGVQSGALVGRRVRALEINWNLPFIGYAGDTEQVHSLAALLTSAGRRR
jgi:hypothetical protein